ncbi:protein timeless homolog [Hemicordylus capensis]|uniref:protein timeless homolog n=1 Tax=Hemicordylus capensis TaxID=884348 RepID=UPI002304B79B|nr:protein timeless homolog [Hemicordylus capensis]XP_053153418.1 protein timeless homolog [Hemicordylus capensis]XP_053153419.1 protein timeless homolog [Hemicordylus capensis]XP_053153420.1 protein timeless homolog [Hemicordylus capensis]
MDLYMMNCELLATCSALGFLEGDSYHKEPDCLESVKDLIRYLRHEDESRDIRQQLGAAQILQNDLIPIIIQYPQDKQLFDAIIRLMVNLTQPALLCFGKLPQDTSFRHHFLQIVSYLQAYKEAFANEKIFGVLSEKLYDLLQLDWEQRQEEDNLLIERILLLVRNVLHVPADPDEEKNVDDDANTHDRVLWAMHISGMDDLLKFLASSQSEQQWSLHVLEIISLMFRDQNPEQLAATGQARSAKERGTDVVELEALRQKELAEKKSRVLQRSSRHSRFGGCYVIQGLKSFGDRDVVMHKGLHNVKNYSHDLGKEARRVPKRKQPAREGEGAPRRSALNVRLFLKEFCTEFLENCYNRLMYLVKDHLIREKAQQHDETYYLWALAFFMAFNRACSFQPQLVSETVSVRTFHFIEQSLTNYYEMLLMDKKEATSWSRRMHLALKAYQELLMTVHEMDHSQEEAVRNSSHILKNNIFYMMEYRELFLTLFRKFDETKQPRSFLKDLVETAHLFLKMLERFCKGRNNLVVQSKKFKRKKKPQVHPAGSDVQTQTPEELEQMWPRLAEQIGKCAKGSEPLPEDVVPFDAASEVPLEEQRAEAMVRIQDSLLAGQAPEALSLLRSAREVWPEGDIFGSSTSEPDEEIELLKQILFANLPRQVAPETDEPEEAVEEEDVAEEELASVRVSEKEFSFLDYMKRFANTNVVKAYVLLFKNYQQNSSHTNHCVVKMLHRIAYDLKMEALLFQLSVFCLFNRLLNDPAAGAYKEMVTFAKYIVGKFFALASTNQKAYMELLFWKNTAVVREMTEGYTLLQEKKGSDSCKAVQWTLEDEEELRELYYKYKEVEGEDILNNILAHLSTRNRTRKQVAKQLVHLGLAKSVRDFPRERKGTRIVLWTQDQELEIWRLFEEFQGTDDILGNMMKHITAKRSKARIIEKLLSMGLVSDRKELYKKRKRKPGSLGVDKDIGVPDLDDINDYEDEEEEEDDLDSEEEEERAWEDGDSDVGNRPLDGCMNKKGAGTSDRDARELVQSLRQEGLSGPLLWLQNCLNRTAADREEDGCTQPVPLVPLSEENEDAMEHGGFQKLLRKAGMRAPASEQESFWRIPAKLSPEQLRRVAASITLQEMEEETKEQPVEEENQEEPRGLLAEKEEAIQLPLGPKRSRLINEEENDSQDSSEEEDGPHPTGKRKRLRIEEDDDED